MKKKYFLWLLCCLIFCGCNPTGNRESVLTTDTQYMGLKTEEVCLVKENLFPIGGIPSDLTFLNDSSFLLSIGKEVVLYNQNGDQLGLFGKYGDGLGEYLFPEKICITSNYVYIWCKRSLKLLKYDPRGNFIEEHRIIKQAIQNFVIWKDRYICFLLNGDIDNARIAIYEIKGGKQVWSAIHPNNVDDILSIAAHSGGIAVIENKLYWCYPSSLKLYEYDLESISEDSGAVSGYSFTDLEFMVDTKNAPYKGEFNNNPKKIFSFIRQNSRIIQVYQLEKRPVILAETGVSEIMNGTLSKKKRALKQYTFSNNNQLDESYKFDYPDYCGLIKGMRDAIYILTGKPDSDTLNIELHKITL